MPAGAIISSMILEKRFCYGFRWLTGTIGYFKKCAFVVLLLAVRQKKLRVTQNSAIFPLSKIGRFVLDITCWWSTVVAALMKSDFFFCCSKLPQCPSKQASLYRNVKIPPNDAWLSKNIQMTSLGVLEFRLVFHYIVTDLNFGLSSE